VFAGVVGYVRHLGWDAGDLFLALWCASLVAGFPLILSGLLGSLQRADPVLVQTLSKRRDDPMRALGPGMALAYLPVAGFASVLLQTPLPMATGIALAVLHLAVVYADWPSLSRAGELRLRMLPGLSALIAFFGVHWYLAHFAQLALFGLVFPEPDADRLAMVMPDALALVREYLWFCLAALLIRVRQVATMWQARDMGEVLFPYGRIVGLQLTLGLVALLEVLGLGGAVLMVVLAVAFFPWHLLGIEIRPANAREVERARARRGAAREGARPR
jgi:hypothetical protein